ncbi:hypothetical protein Tco_0320485 [Tanacetum coccineum]
MVEENVPAPVPTRSEEQVLPFNSWLLIGKGNLFLDLHKLKKNPIFCISVDILQNTNFFRELTSSANVPNIYIQQLWNALTQEAKTGIYKFQLDEQWFTLNGIVTQTNVDYAELMWEEIVQGFQTFFSHRTNLNTTTKKSTPHVIPYCRFTKLIIYYLGNIHNIHRRSKSPMHVTGDDIPLVNLKFVPKGEKDEAFGMAIPKELITEDIQQSPYYQQYQEMVARKPTPKEGEKKKTVYNVEQPKQSKPAKQRKRVKEKASNPSPTKKIRKGKVVKIIKEISSFKLVDEEEEYF